MYVWMHAFVYDMHDCMHVFACAYVCVHIWGDMHAHLWVFLEISFHSSSTLFIETEDLKQIQSFLIWLVLVSPFSGA